MRKLRRASAAGRPAAAPIDDRETCIYAWSMRGIQLCFVNSVQHMDARGQDQRREEMIPLKEESEYGVGGRRSPAGPASRDICKFVCGLFLITLLVVALFGGGLFTGYGAICNRRLTCKCGNPAAAKWGDKVKGSGGTAVPLSQWLDYEIKAENIRENLRFGTAMYFNYNLYCIQWNLR